MTRRGTGKLLNLKLGSEAREILHSFDRTSVYRASCIDVGTIIRHLWGD